MKNKALFFYLIFVFVFSLIFVIAMKILGQKGFFLAGFYMFIPAISAIITRIFFYEKGFSDAKFGLGKLKHWFLFWLIALGITLFSYLVFTLLGAVSWDFSGQTFLAELSKQASSYGQDMTNLQDGMSPFTMLLLFSIGGLTIFNILPGIIMGFGEEFGWRGLMFGQLYKSKASKAFVIGGLIWFLWHLPLSFIIPQTEVFTIYQTILNFVILAIATICTFTFLAYVYVKTNSIWITSFTHIVLNNSAGSFSYFVTINNQILANFGLMLTMILVILVLYYKKELQIFEKSKDLN